MRISERERHCPYIGASDFALRSATKPNALISLVMAGALDEVSLNRRAALWESGLLPVPKRGAQSAMPASMQDRVPELVDFTQFEKMRGEYEVMGIYPSGHLMEFVISNLPRDVLACTAAESAPEGKAIRVAGWPVAGQHPKGRIGAVFITMEDETGYTQLFVRLGVYEHCRRALDGKGTVIIGQARRWDSECVIEVDGAAAVSVSVNMLAGHDWR